MLTFTRFDIDARHSDQVYVDPVAVAVVRETEQRPLYGFAQQVAELTLFDGSKLVVYDRSRDVGRQIAEAKARQAGGSATSSTSAGEPADDGRIPLTPYLGGF